MLEMAQIDLRRRAFGAGERIDGAAEQAAVSDGFDTCHEGEQDRDAAPAERVEQPGYGILRAGQRRRQPLEGEPHGTGPRHRETGRACWREGGGELVKVSVVGRSIE